MRNKNVGFLILGIGAIFGAIVGIFNYGVRNIISATCSHGPSCSMYTSLSVQTWISLAIVGVILLIGLFMVFSKPEEKLVIKKIKETVGAKKKPINYSHLDKEEKVLVKKIEESEGTIFQSDLVEKSGFDKVKVTRILDRLEGKQIIERKRRGMTNVVVLKANTWQEARGNVK